jgi:3-oxoacyl-[acyl-carrier-protein] synthase III
MGHWHPKTVLDNDFFDSLDIGSSSQWIEDVVGIKERRSVMSRDDIVALRHGKITREELFKAGRITSMAEMCKKTWEVSYDRAQNNGSANDVDHVICGSSVPDWNIPANACAIAGELGISASSFDINSACSSFVVNLHVVKSLLDTGASKSALIFNPERYTTRMDYSSRNASVLFGDAASAAVLEANNDVDGLELIDTIISSSPKSYELVQIPDGGVFWQNGKAVQKFAITKTISITLELLERNGLTKEDMSYFIGHQANLRMLTSASEKQNVTGDRHLYNVDVKGNQGAAGAPTVLSENWDKFKSGDIIVVAVVGSGLTWGAALFKKI